ncbi:hypothetical protein BY996DRAFT_7732357 [Phakopsora pachyrhizi]|nr:hypothetical protein BY996DRAFT_7732357 [Phakopsora pachyrhizi]
MLLSELMTETKSLDSITREAISDVVKDVRIPDYHLYNLMDSGLSKDLIKSTESQSNNPKLKINASKGLKFDLNELPENLESEVSDKSERESNINSNKRSLEPFEDSKSLDLSHSPKRLRTKSSITTERTLKPPYLVTEPEADKAPLPVLKGPQLVINQQNKNIELAKHSLNDSNAGSSNKGAANNSALKRKKTAKKKMENLNAMKSLEPRPFLIETIKTLLSVEIKKSGPFDLEGKRKYSSPYNRDLLDLLEKKLQSVMPKELDEFEFQDGFLITIKENFWSNNLGMFFTSEKLIPGIFLRVDFDSQTKKRRCSWIRFSAKGLKNNKKKIPAKYFSFTEVFTSFIKFENLSRFFYTDNIRQKSILFFDNLNKSLLKGKEGYGHKRKTPENAILNQIWLGMNGFLAYVHAINAIILPSESLVPLKQEQLVAKQEEAFKFFCDLHKDFEKFCSKQRAKKCPRRSFTIKTENLSFEEIRDNSMNQLFESKLSRNKVAWIYIELWLIKCRPELQNINFGFLRKQNIIKRNRMCLIFFSGMVKRETLEHEKLAERELQI